MTIENISGLLGDYPIFHLGSGPPALNQLAFKPNAYTSYPYDNAVRANFKSFDRG
ncbi:uncharacterized protein CANTADRAFT_90479 [Suhomyces tanzawaensis NRRL Y-17324]|uniref:Uncharacterized protein n=1 Tax=Suhomyces tanzawaensis NRRL Y-17324 TaxID=984487 RepID=A0A1E4SIS2_9ASCO|nr:uncharacterized protein CANTADRAFT_90479 [Suhomyces tanzawaensis NRRL Y-17324]ODV79390.1 hypothetical protein CANTADRAFT_90479 [Suhomyces tanzawaensis NRRL Y-17324]